MRKKISAIIYATVLLLIQSFVYGQDCDCKLGLSSGIKKEVADARIDFFKKVKLDMIKNTGSTADYLAIAGDEMKNVLQNIKNVEGNKYDGVRIYYALNDLKLTIVLVPTTDSKLIDENNDNISEDDSTNAYIFYSGKFNKVDLTKNATVVKGMNIYTNLIAKRIELEFSKKYGIKLSETHSLWYADKVLLTPGDYGCDLLSYLTKCATIKQVNIHFASWIYEPDYLDNLKYIFKMDLIFELIEENKPPTFLTLGATEIKKNLLEHGILKDTKQKLAVSYADTGLPCPPNKCP